MKRFLPLFVVSSLFVFSSFSFNLDQLSDADQKKVSDILHRWQGFMEGKKKDGSAILIDFETIYAPLDPDQRSFLDELRGMDPKKEFNFQGEKFDTTLDCGELVRLSDQQVERNSKKELLEPQALPRSTYETYVKMNEAMEKVIGKKLLVESGYRSPAYQLYTFLFYLPKHRYSLRETAKWIALPGYSEHGAPQKQAIDFINQEGINGEDDVTAFEKLPEYVWLLKNAGQYGFELSYPRDKRGITFEPWHWHHRNPSCEKQ